MKNLSVIKMLFVCFAMMMSCVFLFASCNQQEQFEEQYKLALEDTIDEFKADNVGVVQSVTYDITFYGQEEVEVIFYVKSSQDITNYTYVSLLYPDTYDYDIPISTDTYGKVYVNGELKYTRKSYDYSFTNKYGTSTTKCHKSGCDNYIASSGDTNCCVEHSNRCAYCNCYIDGDAFVCMDCLYDAVGE